MRILRYFALLRAGKLALWCYLAWYLATVWLNFDPAPWLWLNALGVSIVVGVALVLGVGGRPWARGSRWQTARLFMMPFCVSSYAALTKDKGYLLVFPATLRELVATAGACAAFLLLAWLARRLVPVAG